jgi:hypothetical protein
MSNVSLTRPFMSKNILLRDFIDVVLNMGGSDEDEGGGTGNDATS